MNASTLSRRALPALLALPLFAAGRSATARAEAPLRVLASISILQDMVREVGGDAVVVSSLVGPDGDAHLYQPRPSDLRLLSDASLVVRNGLGLEPWLDRLLSGLNRQLPVVVAASRITPRPALPGEPKSGHDPHAWQSVPNAISYATVIGAGLAKADPARTAQWEAGTKAYITRLQELDAWVRQQFAGIPPERRKVITSHDAFGYYGATYGITFMAPQGINTDAEPSAAAVATLIRQIRAEHVTAVFIENMTRPTTLDRLADEAGVKVRGELYADSLSPPNGPAPTYEAMIRHNTTLLAAAMRG